MSYRDAATLDFGVWHDATAPRRSDMNTIDLTPTDEGFAGLAKMYVDSILAGSRKAAVTNNALQLDALLEIAAYLARSCDPALLASVRAYAVRRGQ